MRVSTNHGRIRKAVGVAFLAAALVVPAAVNADTIPADNGQATVTVDNSVRVLNKVVATVSISFTCDPFLVYDWETGQYVPSTTGFLEESEVTLIQASGKTIGSATGGLRLTGPVTCDGQSANSGSVVIAATTVPWKSGAAVATATVQVVDSQFQTSDNGTSGPVPVKLTGK